MYNRKLGNEIIWSPDLISVTSQANTNFAAHGYFLPGVISVAVILRENSFIILQL